jgi:ribonuclease P protein component
VPPPPVPPPLVTLTRRADFLAAARARRAGMPGLLLQARRRREGEGDASAIRVGFTCSRKVGNAVARNRAKRRLREAARAVLPRDGHAGWDYVLIGRPAATALRPFPMLLQDLRDALARVHAGHGPAPARRTESRPTRGEPAAP